MKLFFFRAHYIEEFVDGDGDIIGFSLLENLNYLGLVLIIAAIVIAWFNSKIGGFLITIFAILIIVTSDALPEEMIMQQYAL